MIHEITGIKRLAGGRAQQILKAEQRSLAMHMGAEPAKQRRLLKMFPLSRLYHISYWGDFEAELSRLVLALSCVRSCAHI